MTYRVELTDRAVRDLEALYLEKNAEESRTAAHWFNGLEKAVLGLSGTLTVVPPPLSLEG